MKDWVEMHENGDSPHLLVEGVAQDDGLLTVGARGDDVDRYAGQFLHPRQVLACVVR